MNNHYYSYSNDRNNDKKYHHHDDNLNRNLSFSSQRHIMQNSNSISDSIPPPTLSEQS